MGRDVDVTVSITTQLSGTATLSSKDADVEVEGTASVSPSKTATPVVFNCKFKKLPKTVRLLKNHRFAWTLDLPGAGGPRKLNATPLTLFVVDEKPKKVTWPDPNKDLYDWVLEYSCRWANGQTGADDVFKAIWKKFSTGTKARVPHETGYIYWKKNSCIQALYALRYSKKGGKTDGWSCRAICHFFMMSIAAHGLDCQSVIPTGTPLGFLVAEWTLAGAGGDPANAGLPGPLSGGLPAGFYYGGDWDYSAPPKAKKDRKGWHRDAYRTNPHPGQGQSNPVIVFANHWILDLKSGPTGLYDTSYGGGKVAKTAGSGGVPPAPLGDYQLVAISGWQIPLGGDPLIVVKPNFVWSGSPISMMINHGPDAHT
jgi:hypothetical protein